MIADRDGVKIIIATHKKYRMPDDGMYLPLHVGAEGKKSASGEPLELGYQKDNTGDNISKLNPYFCELTGLYWAWKNLGCEYLGLVHYRRHLCFVKNKDKYASILTYDELKPLLQRYSVIVPKKRRYYIESLYNHYAHTHYASHLDITRQIIDEHCHDYLASYDKVIRRSWGYMFNMMIMPKDLVDEYCSWLFDILFELQKRIDISSYSAFQKRLFGRVSEIIFNVWLDYQLQVGKIKKGDIKELKYINMEKTNWAHKLNCFMKAKFIHDKYEGSF